MVDANKDIQNLPFVRQYNQAGNPKQPPNAITSQWVQNMADPFKFGFKPNPLAAELYGKKSQAQKPLSESLQLDKDFKQSLSGNQDNLGPSTGVEAMASRLQFFGNSETLPSQN